MVFNKLNFKKIFRYVYLRAVRIRGTPREIGLGMAIGLVVGMCPIPIQMATAAVVAMIFRASKLSAMIGTWFTNPLTDIPILYSAYTVGALVLGRDLNPTTSVKQWIDATTNFNGVSEYVTSFLGVIFADLAVPLWVGGLILSVPLSIAGYWLTYQGVVAYRLKKERIRLMRLHEWKWSEELGWYRSERNPPREGM